MSPPRVAARRGIGSPAPPRPALATMARRLRRSFPRPLRAVRAASATVLVLALWAAVAHQSGSGWVQAVGAVVAAIVVTGLVAPAAATAMLALVVELAPADGTAGQELRLAVRANGGARLTPVEPKGSQLLVIAGQPADLLLLPARRGVVDRLVIDVASAWPFGLLWWNRRLVVELPRPIHVAPRRGEPLGAEQCPGTGEPGAPAVRATSGELRGIRPYRPGDERRRVHWPVTAHAAELMVAEHEDPGRRGEVRLRAELPADEEAAEERAGRVLGSVLELLERGDVVLLETDERERGRIVETVAEARQAGRRLARAVGVGSGQATGGPSGPAAGGPAAGAPAAHR